MALASASVLQSPIPKADLFCILFCISKGLQPSILLFPFVFFHQLCTAQLFLRAVPLHSDNTPAAGCTRGESKGSQQLFLGLDRSSTSSTACPVPGEHAPEPVSPFQSSLGDTHPQQSNAVDAPWEPRGLSGVTPAAWQLLGKRRGTYGPWRKKICISYNGPTMHNV